MKIEAISNIYDCENSGGGIISVTFPPPEKLKTNFKLKVHFRNGGTIELFLLTAAHRT